jgi:2'-5' RNA ligase
VRWTRPESWHLTLLFLGSVAPERVPEVIIITDEAAAEHGRFRILAGRNGGRLGRGGGVGWLGLELGGADVVRLASWLATACPDDITTGHSRPRRTPTPHLTVARRVDEGTIASLHDEDHGPLAVEWMAKGISLYRSHLGQGGSTHETLQQVALSGPARPPDATEV